MITKNARWALFIGTAASLFGHGQAWAAGTVAGTTVSNSASVSFSVGGVAQPTVNTTAPASFVVDRRVNLTVAEVGGTATQSAPGSTDQVTTFTVTNSTNATMDFRLLASQDANGATTAFSDTDNFNATNVRVYVDNGDNIFNAGDTATFIDELAPDTTVRVFVVADMPGGQADGSTAGITLTAISADSGTVGTLGADSTQTSGADTPGSVDTVFGDAAGDTDAARDGRFSDDDEYDIAAATVSLLKNSRVISDPFNATTNPKAIPGAVVEYCIRIENSGGAPATSLAISDSLPANTSYVAGSLLVGGTVTGGLCNTDGSAEDDDASGGDESDPNGGGQSAGVVSATLPTLSSGTTTTAVFRVTVD